MRIGAQQCESLFLCLPSTFPRGFLDNPVLAWWQRRASSDRVQYSDFDIIEFPSSIKNISVSQYDEEISDYRINVSSTVIEEVIDIKLSKQPFISSQKPKYQDVFREYTQYLTESRCFGIHYGFVAHGGNEWSRILSQHLPVCFADGEPGFIHHTVAVERAAVPRVDRDIETLVSECEKSFVVT